jgi:hypothetical protein
MSTTTRPRTLAAPPVQDVVAIFRDHNPELPRAVAETAGRAAAALAGAAVRLTAAQQRLLLSHRDRLATMIGALIDTLDPAPSSDDDEAGDGLEAPLPVAEGRRRLTAYAASLALEDWAGAVEGPTAIERDLGVARSTLHEWQARNAAIGLLKGTRKHVFPLAQFVDGRPVEGLAAVVAAAGSPRTAWLWLVEPHPSLGGDTPLERLKAGGMDEVAGLVARDFGQP